MACCASSVWVIRISCVSMFSSVSSVEVFAERKWEGQYPVNSFFILNTIPHLLSMHDQIIPQM